MGAYMRGLGHSVVAVVFGCLFAAGARAAPSTSSTCAGTAPAFLTDSDGDGIVDACDPCPMRADSSTEPSRDPYCYLGMGQIPSAYLASSDGASIGNWWTAGGCVPSMAFPVSHPVAGGGQGLRGLVVVGAAAGEAASALMAARAGQPWPASVNAACLVSLTTDNRYHRCPPWAPRAPALATTYATWTGPDVDGYFPSAGLGLVQSWPIETIEVRGPERTVEFRTPAATLFAGCRVRKQPAGELRFYGVPALHQFSPKRCMVRPNNGDR